MKLPVPLRILNCLGTLLFAAASSVQANDIDPKIYDHASRLDAALWLLFYALIAVLFAVTLFKRVPRWVLLLSALACLAEMTRAAPGLWNNLFGEQSFTMVQRSMSADDPRVELTREFLGALIALAGVGFLWWERRRFAKPTPPPPRPPAGS